MSDETSTSGAIVDTATIQRMAAHSGVRLDPDRAAVLVPFVQGLLDADARLAALDLRTLPAAGAPWGPFAAPLGGEGGGANGG